MSPEQNRLFEEYNQGVDRAAGRPVYHKRQLHEDLSNEDQLKNKLLDTQAELELALAREALARRRLETAQQTIEQLKQEKRKRRA